MANDKKKKNIAVIGGWGSAPYIGDKSRPLNEVYGVSNERGGGFLTRKGEKDIYGSNAVSPPIPKTKPAEKATINRSGLLPQNPFSLTKRSGDKVTPAEKSRLQRFAVISAVDKAGADAKSSSADPVKSNTSAKTNKEAPSVRKAATDKSRLAPKMTNYQRMQATQLEKEGYAGRSLTRAQAQKMAGAKSASNTSSLMSLFGISKKKTETPKAGTPKRLTSDFAKKNLAANQKIGKSK